MENLNVDKVQALAQEIMEKTNALMRCTDPRELLASGELNKCLIRICQCATEIEGESAATKLLAGYRDDALQQSERCGQLIEEAKSMESGPGDLQIRSLALSFECALDRIGKYLRAKMQHNMLEKSKVLSGKQTGIIDELEMQYLNMEGLNDN